MLELLNPLAELTDMLSGEKYVTSSSILPLIGHIQDVCAFTETSELINDLKQRILRYIYPR